MKLLKQIFILFVVLFFSQCAKGQENFEKNFQKEEYQLFVDTIESIQYTTSKILNDSVAHIGYSNKVVWEYFLKFRIEGLLKKTLPFKNYFAIFNKLSIEKGWKMNWVYFYDSLAGRGNPTIIAIKETDNFDDFKHKFKNISELNDYIQYKKFLEHIVVDSSALGYFQFYILSEYGDQLVHYSHHKIYDGCRDLVCSFFKLKQTLNMRSATDKCYNFSNDQFNKMKIINPYPTFQFNKDSCVLRVVYFSIHGGFKETYLKISTTFPFKIDYIKSNTLVEFWSDVIMD